jgi:hypothetical protein
MRIESSIDTTLVRLNPNNYGVFVNFDGCSFDLNGSGGLIKMQQPASGESHTFVGRNCYIKTVLGTGYTYGVVDIFNDQKDVIGSHFEIHDSTFVDTSGSSSGYYFIQTTGWSEVLIDDILFWSEDKTNMRTIANASTTEAQDVFSVVSSYTNTTNILYDNGGGLTVCGVLNNDCAFPQPAEPRS